jgi:hypothetical protein
MAISSLEAAFVTLTNALAKGDLEGFYGLMLSDAVIMDEDLPFRVDKAGFQGHIAFHGPDNWEGSGHAVCRKWLNWRSRRLCNVSRKTPGFRVSTASHDVQPRLGARK